MKKVAIAIVLVVAAATVLTVKLMKGRGKGAAPAAEAADAGFTIFPVDAWLDSCLGGCRRKAQRQLGHLSAEKQRQFCDVNCECGMEKMTEPGPKAGQVKAPSAAWLRLSEDQQMQAADECQKRSTAAVGGIQPPGAP